MTNRRCVDVMPSPLGPLTLVAEGDALAAILFPGGGADGVADAGPLRAVREQLEAYFAGERPAFDLVLSAGGTVFQQRVWAALRAIPYGATASYLDVARAIGQPTACRAVGLANGRNPLPIVVPCHRVIGASGKLVGFGGGLDAKRWLLTHERSERGVTLRSPRPRFGGEG